MNHPLPTQVPVALAQIWYTWSATHDAPRAVTCTRLLDANGRDAHPSAATWAEFDGGAAGAAVLHGKVISGPLGRKSPYLLYFPHAAQTAGGLP